VHPVSIEKQPSRPKPDTVLDERVQELSIPRRIGDDALGLDTAYLGDVEGVTLRNPNALGFDVAA